MILADSSIWVDHFRSINPQFESLIGSGRIIMHPFVIGEIALGSLRERYRKLALMGLLEQTQVASVHEVGRMIEARKLYSCGIGYVDAHLIASCLLTAGTQLWTRDTRLASTAQFAGVRIYSTP